MKDYIAMYYCRGNITQKGKLATHDKHDGCLREYFLDNRGGMKTYYFCSV
jgi:hypothetical protein